MIKACIFDLDGTLTNTLDSLEYSVNETMKEIGRPQITKEQCRQFVGDGAKVLLERTLKAGGDTKLCHLEEAVEAYARIFDANCMYKVAPYERNSTDVAAVEREWYQTCSFIKQARQAGCPCG